MKMEKERKGERGQSLTEFAVGVTFILVLLAGGMDFGRAYFSASIAPADVTGIRGRVRDTSANPIDLSAFSDDQIDIVISGSACAGNTISVTVEYDFNIVAPFIAGNILHLEAEAFNIVAPFIAGNILHLEAEAIDTILQPPC